MVAVVMVDEDSPADQLKAPLLALKDVIVMVTPPIHPHTNAHTTHTHEHTHTHTQKCEGRSCFILDGGYCGWYLAYPVTTFGRYKPAQRSEVNVQAEESPQLAYPTLENTRQAKCMHVYM